MRATVQLLPGDGVGPEVTREAARVLAAVAARFGHRFDFAEAPVGGAGIDAGGGPLPDATLAACRAADAVFLGAVGGPRWEGGPGPRPEQGLLALRRALDVYANLRPVRVPDAAVPHSALRPERVQGVDLLFVRELTGGLYFGPRHRRALAAREEEAVDTCRYATAEIARVARRAGALARGRRGIVTSVDKANVLETSRLWRETVTRVFRDEFPDLTLRHLLVDACAMELLRAPRAFDVVLTENLFGDILSDEAAMLTGSIGLLPSASLGRVGDPGLFEPVHGSAPDLAGTDRANPCGAILSAALLLRHGLGLEPEARAVEAAVDATLARGPLPADLGGTPPAGTAALGTAVADLVAAGAGVPA